MTGIWFLTQSLLAPNVEQISLGNPLYRDINLKGYGKVAILREHIVIF